MIRTRFGDGELTAVRLWREGGMGCADPVEAQIIANLSAAIWQDIRDDGYAGAGWMGKLMVVMTRRDYRGAGVGPTHVWRRSGGSLRGFESIVKWPGNPWGLCSIWSCRLGASLDQSTD